MVIETTMGSRTLVGWPTDTFAMDWCLPEQEPPSPGNTTTTTTSQQQQQPPPRVHTVLVFVPGNPGLIEWYVPFFRQLLTALGPGHACRGAANAAHSLDPHKAQVLQASNANNDHAADTSNSGANKNPSIPWTVDGQSLHKCAFVDAILEEFESSSSSNCPGGGGRIQLIFVSHSIGCHFTQRLCTWRRDILDRTVLFLFLTPFVRMKPPQGTFKSGLLHWAGGHPETTIQGVQSILQQAFSGMTADHKPSNPTATSSSSSNDREDNSSSTTTTTTRTTWSTWKTNAMWALHNALLSRASTDEEGRDILLRLLQIPAFPRNFFTLGCEEIRQVPEQFDVCALRYLSRQCPIALLFASNDVWSPEFHMHDLQQLLQHEPHRYAHEISLTHRPELQHDFVSAGSEQVPIVVQYCLERIQQAARTTLQLQQEERQPPPPQSLPPVTPLFARARL